MARPGVKTGAFVSRPVDAPPSRRFRGGISPATQLTACVLTALMPNGGGVAPSVLRQCSGFGAALRITPPERGLIMRYKSNFVFDLRGSLGGLTASVARGGVGYLRERVTPTNPQTLLQTAIRTAVSSASAAWQFVLTEAQQQAWWDLAGLIGGTQQGKTLFSKVNQPRIYANNTGRITDEGGTPAAGTLALIDDAPGGLAVSGTVPQGVTIDDSDNALKIATIPAGEWNADAQEGEESVVYVFVSGPQPPSRFSRAFPYQIVAAMKVESNADIDNVSINLASWGIPTVVGRDLYVKTYMQAPDGRISVPVEQRISVTA